MSDLKDRVGLMTGANANLLPDKACILVGDGQQTIYLRADPMGPDDGKVPTIDSTAESGISWQPGGGGGGGITNVLGADGISVTTPSSGVRTVHNLLVLGTPVAQVDAESNGGIILNALNGEVQISTQTGSEDIHIDSAGAIGITSQDATLSIQAQATSSLEMRSTGSGHVFLISNAGQLLCRGFVQAQFESDSGPCTLQATGGDCFVSAADDGTNLHMTAAQNITISTSGSGTNIGAILIEANGNTTGQCDITLSQAGAGAILFNTASGPCTATINGDISLDAVSANFEFSGIQGSGAFTDHFVVDGVNFARITGGLGASVIEANATDVLLNPSANIIFFGKAPGAPQHAAIPNATGGTVQDAEVRTQVATINAFLSALGLTA